MRSKLIVYGYSLSGQLLENSQYWHWWLSKQISRLVLHPQAATQTSLQSSVAVPQHAVLAWTNLAKSFATPDTRDWVLNFFTPHEQLCKAVREITRGTQLIIGCILADEDLNHTKWKPWEKKRYSRQSLIGSWWRSFESSVTTCFERSWLDLPRCSAR